jgi:MoaA/NifB/PqqE/SkfB family radical SAM enzyme
MILSRHLKLVFRYLAYRPRKIHPFDVEAVLLNHCDLRCPYCHYPDRPKPQLSTRQWKEIIRGFASLGTLRFKFHGGEPTLRPDFGELSAEAKATGMIVAATTNGQTIADKPELLDYLDEVIISLDSPHPEANDRMRGKGSHQKAMKTIDLALERRVRTYLNMVLTRANLNDLEDMLAFCEARGLRMNAQPIALGGMYYVEQARSLELEPDEIREVHRRLILWKKQGRALFFSRSAYQKVLDWPDYQKLSVKGQGPSPCVAGSDFIRVESDGDILPCCQYNADFAPKNILRHGLRESLLHVQKHNCADCWLAFYNERTALFKLRPGAVWEAIRRG